VCTCLFHSFVLRCVLHMRYSLTICPYILYIGTIFITYLSSILRAVYTERLILVAATRLVSVRSGENRAGIGRIQPSRRICFGGAKEWGRGESPSGNDGTPNCRSRGAGRAFPRENRESRRWPRARDLDGANDRRAIRGPIG
jgi:hypothetical protein